MEGVLDSANHASQPSNSPRATTGNGQPRSARSLRQRLLATAGVRLLRSRREREKGLPFIYTIDLLRCAAPGQRTCFLLVTWRRGDLCCFQAHLTRSEALACWRFAVHSTESSEMAIPALLGQRQWG